MTEVVSFEGYTPPARWDGVHWTQARIEEAATSSGSWATIDTISLSPVDSDPSTPATRNLTTDQGTAADLWYRITFIDVDGDTSLPTSPVQNTATDSSLYVTVEELKKELGLKSESFSDLAIQRAVWAASRSCDGYKSTRFYPVTETRTYTALFGDRTIRIDDLTTLTSLTLDLNGDGVYESTWTDGTEFVLHPRAAPLDQRPYNEITLLRQSGAYFPVWDGAVKVTGVFGWPQVPWQVTQAVALLAKRWLYRTEQAPLGILVAMTADAVTAARLGRIDPDVAFLLEQIPGARQAPLASLQLS